MASATAPLNVPYPEVPYSTSRSGIGRPVATDSNESRFDTPGFASTSNLTAVSESVTADLTFFVIAFGSSRTRIVPWGDSTDLLILASGR